MDNFPGCKPPQKMGSPSTLNWKFLLVIICAFSVIIGLAYWALAEPFLTAIRPELGKTAASSFPAYGQLGDAVGGLLNPFFGFVTVCMLVWSLRLQMFVVDHTRHELHLSRQELALTREEMAKSADALHKQVKVSQNEYNRKQIEDAVDFYIARIDSLFAERACFLPEPEHDPLILSASVGPIPFSINDALQDLQLTSIGNSCEKIVRLIQVTSGATYASCDYLTAEHIANVRMDIARLLACATELGRKKYVSMAVLGVYWEQRIKAVLKKSVLAGIIDSQTSHKYQRDLYQILVDGCSTFASSETDTQ